jgi:hypothetical protein
LPDRRRQLLIGSRRHARGDCRAQLAAVAVGAVTAGASLREDLPASICGLRACGRSKEEGCNESDGLHDGTL